MSQIILKTNTRIPAAPSSEGWLQELLFNEADEFFSALLNGIHDATSSIDLETYIFEDDLVGQRVIDALDRATQKGIKVRVLMDAAGSNQSGHSAANKLESAGIEVKIFHPLPWQIHHYHRAATHQGSFLDQCLYFFNRINQRDHRKLCIIDGDKLWSGSFNISQAHLSKNHGGEGWRDYGIYTSGHLVGEISSHFDAVWNRRVIQRKQGLFKHYWDNYDLWTRRRKNQLLRQHLRKATQRAWIVSAYFAPSAAVIRELKDAGQRGVDVKIVVPSLSDIGIFPFLTATYYADLIQSGIKMFEYQPSVLHAKALIIDDFYLVGSTNFNHRSFLHDLELDIRLNQPHSQNTLEHFFLDDIKKSIAVTQDNPRYGFWGNVIGAIARILRYWM